jgi:hypothetical protein
VVEGCQFALNSDRYPIRGSPYRRPSCDFYYLKHQAFDILYVTRSGNLGTRGFEELRVPVIKLINKIQGIAEHEPPAGRGEAPRP